MEHQDKTPAAKGKTYTPAAKDNTGAATAKAGAAKENTGTANGKAGTANAKVGTASASKPAKSLLRVALIAVLFAVISVAYFSPAVFEGRDLFQQDIAGASGVASDVKESGVRSYWTNSLFGGMPMFQINPTYPSTQVAEFVQQALMLKAPIPILGNYAWVLFSLMAGFYLFMRSLKLRRVYAALGGILWAFSSYFLILVVAGHLWKVMALCFIPPTIAGMIYISQRRYLYGGVLLGIFTALQVLSNHVQMTYYFLFVMLAFLIAFVIECIRGKEWRHLWLSLGVMLLAGGAGVATNLTNLYQTYRYSKFTMRGGSEVAAVQTTNTPQEATAGTEEAAEGAASSANQTAEAAEGTAEASRQTAEAAETAASSAQQATNASGLSTDYITQWSYGTGEMLTLLVPNAKGGASGSMASHEKAFAKVPAMDRQYVAQFSSYWGNQPFTSGPVYVGAFVVLLFIIGLFVVKGSIKWVLLGCTLLSILLSLGKNFMPLTQFFIDVVPLYDKFRAVSSILVIAEFCIPALAVLALARLVRNPELLRSKRVWVPSAAVVVFLLLLWIVPSALPLVSHQEREFFAQAMVQDPAYVQLKNSLTAARAEVFRADVGRSLLFLILPGALLAVILLRKDNNKSAQRTLIAVSAVAVITLIDLWTVNKRYLHDALFIPQEQVMAQAAPQTEADRQILADKEPGFRVLNLSVNTYNDATTSRWHRSIGGYHAAKLQRYQDLIDRYLSVNYRPVVDMLNVKYFILPTEIGPQAVLNEVIPPAPADSLVGRGLQHGEQPSAQPEGRMGAAWFPTQVSLADNAARELDLLGQVDLRTTAVVAREFASDNLPLRSAADTTAHISITRYTPGSITYRSQSAADALAVFSEIYYPEGWHLYLDGTEKELPLLRADYVLRAAVIPAGEHTLQFVFKPLNIEQTEAISYAAQGLLAIGLLVLLGQAALRLKRKENTPTQNEQQ